MKKRNQKKTAQYESAPTIKTPKPISDEDIRQRAQELFQARGGAPGRELDDWLLAERQLKGTNARPETPAQESD